MKNFLMFVAHFWVAAAFFGAVLGLPLPAMADAPAVAHGASSPVVFVDQMATKILQALNSEEVLRSAEAEKIMPLMDSLLMPHVNFSRMTALAVGPAWRQATPEQRRQLQEQFKQLLVRTYAGALAQVNAQGIRVQVLPWRGTPQDKDTVVSTRVYGRGDSIQLDFRLQKMPTGEWRVYNINVLGVWFMETYRNQFMPIVQAEGVQGLIARLNDHNGPKQLAAKAAKPVVQRGAD